jgi:putative membrane protein
MLALIGVALLLILLFPATFGYHSGPLGFGPFGILGGFFVFFLFIIIILWIARLAMWSSRSRGGYYRQGYGGGRRYGAVAIARQRYARGEITREQFDQIMQDLQRHPGYPPPP